MFEVEFAASGKDCVPKNYHCFGILWPLFGELDLRVDAE